MQNKKDEINIENKELKILLNLIPELTTLTPDGIFLKENRIAIPNELQDRALVLAQENHSGIAKMIALFREKTYFVDMEARVKAKMYARCRYIKKANTSTVTTLNSSTIYTAHNQH